MLGLRQNSGFGFQLEPLGGRTPDRVLILRSEALCSREPGALRTLKVDCVGFRHTLAYENTPAVTARPTPTPIPEPSTEGPIEIKIVLEPDKISVRVPI